MHQVYSASAGTPDAGFPRAAVGRSRWLQGSYLNLSVPIGDGEESLKCSRCLGLFCPEI